MTLTAIRFHPSSIPLYKPFVISLGPLTHANNVFVELRTDDGRTGWGEASPFPTIHGETVGTCLSVGTFLGELLVGHEIGDLAGLHQRMDAAIYGNNCIKSAIDMACYDLLAQATEQPLYTYLGGTNAKELFTDYTVSLGPAETMAPAARALQQQGYPAIKLKIGDGVEADLARLHAVRQAVGPDPPLRLDANQGWSLAEARAILPRIAAEIPNVQHLEAPIDKRDWPRLAELRALSTLPIMADESCCDHHDARRLIEAGCVDRINIKLSKSGGFYKALKIIDLAENYGIPLQIGGFLESRLGFTAAAHLALSSAMVRFCDFDTPLMQTEDPVRGGITYGAAGRVKVGERPGLGCYYRPLHS